MSCFSYSAVEQYIFYELDGELVNHKFASKVMPIWSHIFLFGEMLLGCKEFYGQDEI
jgi:hypothetical protein